MTTLRLSTFHALGGAQQIVEEHLDRAMRLLTPAQQDAAAGMFDHLVTPSGAKIAHAAGDLAAFAAVDTPELEPVLGALARERILRPLGENGHAGERYEIYHDVLGSAVLGWRARHETERVLAEERAVARRRHRRLAVLAALALIGLALTSALAVYAFSQRSNAQEQASLAQSNQRAAEQAAATAQEQRDAARAAQANASAAEETAEQQSELAQQEKEKADAAAAEAERQQENAEASAEKEAASADAAQQAAAEADAERAVATQSKNAAVASAAEAKKQKTLADQNAARAQRNAARAQRNAAAARTAQRSAQARELRSRAASLLLIDPDRSLQLALEASKLERTVGLERVLRAALLAVHAQRILPGAGGQVRAVAYSPDGSLALVAATGGIARVFSTARGRVVARLKQPSYLTTAEMSPDGSLAATAGRDGIARVWSLPGGRRLEELAHGDLIRTVAFSPDARLLATGGNDGLVRVWEVATGRKLYERRHPVRVDDVSFSRDGRLLLVVSRDAYVYETDSGRPVSTLDRRGRITAAAFSPDGTKAVTGGLDDLAVIWDVPTGGMLHTLTGHSGNISDVAFSPRGDLVATASDDDSARVWRVDSGDSVSIVDHPNHVTRVVFSSDGRLVATASRDGTARVKNLALNLTATLLGHLAPLTDVAFAPDRRTILTGSIDGSARIWTSAIDPSLGVVATHTKAANAAEFDHSGRLIVSGGSDGAVRITRLNGDVVLVIQQGGVVTDASFSPDGESVLTAAADGVARLWQVSSGALVRSFEHKRGDRLASARFDRPGTRIVTAGTDGVAQIWNAASGARITAITQESPLTSAVFSPDGTLVATSSEDAIGRIWRIRDGKVMHALAGHRSVVRSIAFSPNGRLLLTSSDDNDAQLWSVQTGKTLRVLRGHSTALSDATFSPDGRWIVTAAGISVGLWETTTGRRLDPGRPLLFLRGYAVPRIRSAAFDPSSRRIVSAGDDGTVRTYLCEICGTLPELVRLGERRLARLSGPLTPAERRRYLGMR
jgi:WD40 repeat protein